MTEAGRNLVINPAKKVNPNVKVIIKYPNWYDHFQGLGFNLEKGPFLFDGIWTGTETRDPGSAQHLQNYLGMIGLPMDEHPVMAEDQKALLLTAQAAGDPELITKIRRQLQDGRDVIITTGLLKLEQERLADIVELQCGDLKALVNDFGRHGQSSRDILIPQVLYYTNDSWEVVSAGRPLSGGVSGYPILHRAIYSKGNLYVLTIPDDFGQLYDYPQGALKEIRRTLSKDLDAYLDAPSKVSLFLYDNKTLVVENFNDEPVEISIMMNEKQMQIKDLLTGETINAIVPKVPQDRWARRYFSSDNAFKLTLKPHSYRAFSY